MRKYSCDFETTTDENDCRVWAYAINEVGKDTVEVGNSIEGFLEWCYNLPVSAVLTFHNLKFDGEFILNELFRQGYTWINDKADRDNFTFQTLITEMGQWYQIQIFWVKAGKLKYVKIQDSLKLLNFSVDQIAKAFDLPIRKLDLDYTRNRDIGHVLTDHEIDYISNDVKIVGQALSHLKKMGLTKMTIGSNALSNYKESIREFPKYFPELDVMVDRKIRQAYRGGWTYANPLHVDKEQGSGLILDRNSMYPAVMYQEALPYGRPIAFEGQYQFDRYYPLYIQTLTCNFELKPGRLPSIQIKNSPSFMSNHWLTSSKSEAVTLNLATPDLEVFFSNYEVTDLTFQGGFKFQAIRGLFQNYIDYWTKQKIQSKKENNKPLYLISKLMLNSLYGKMGTNPVHVSKQPYWTEQGVRFKNLEATVDKPVYIPMAVFITAYARKCMITTAQKIRDLGIKKYQRDVFYYADTDSCHCGLTHDDYDDLAKIIKLDSFELGAWDVEGYFDRAKYLRQKCYIEEIDGENSVHIAGLPAKLAKYVNFDNFRFGFDLNDLPQEVVAKYPKLAYKHVKGGVILTPTKFTIK